MVVTAIECDMGSDVDLKDLILLVREECRFHYLHDAANLRMCDELSLLAVHGGAEITVEVMDIALGNFQIVLVQRQMIAGRHGLGDACGVLHGRDILLDPLGHLGDVAGMLPVCDDRGTRLALHVEARHGDEIVCTQLNASGGAALKIDVDLEAVIDLVVGVVGAMAADALDFFVGDELQHLVDHVNAPVKDHAAAMRLFTAPVGRDSARAVDAGSDVECFADLAALNQALDGEEVNVPTAILVNGKERARFLRCGDHAVNRGTAHFNRLFADDMLACLQPCDDQFLVNVVRNGDHDSVNRRVGKDCFVGFINVNAVCDSRITANLANVISTGKGGDITLEKLGAMPCALSAVADNCDVLHAVSPCGNREVREFLRL